MHSGIDSNNNQIEKLKLATDDRCRNGKAISLTICLWWPFLLVVTVGHSMWNCWIQSEDHDLYSGVDTN